MKIILEKGDSEGQIKMAEALLANKLVSAIETVNYQSQKVYKSDDEVAKAVIVVVGLFGVCTQWTAVYRVFTGIFYVLVCNFAAAKIQVLTRVE